MDDVLRAAVHRIAYRQFAKSIRRKIALLLTAVVAIGVVIGLDALRAELQEAKATPYRAVAALKKTATGDGPLETAIRQLRDDEKFANADALFEAVLAKTANAKTSSDRQTAIRTLYDARLRVIDSQIDALLAQEPVPDSEKTPGTDTVDKLETRRASLLLSRAKRLDEIQQNATIERTSLRRDFDEKYANNARLSFRYHPRLRQLSDPTDPLSVIYDILWYASLIIGVLAIVALLLAPLFTSLSLTGAEDSFMEQIRGLLRRPGRTIASGIASLAALGVGTAAIVNNVASASNSPWNAPGVGPQRVIEQKVEIETIQRAELPSTDTAQKTTTGDPEPTTPTPPDPRIDRLLTDVQGLRETDERHTVSLGEHEAVVQNLRRVPEVLGSLDQKIDAQKGAIDDGFRAANDTIDKRVKSAEEYFDLAIDRTALKTKDLETKLDDATTNVGKEAVQIRSGVYMPYGIGERPSFVRSFLGFDRYRITANVPVVLREVGGIEVAEKVEALVSDELLSSDDLLLALRDQLCPEKPTKNCRDFREWSGVVMRAARVR
ncbi:MAG TPA: hypothetical protein VMU84_19520 [Thermoanaerobaculia bacterium]|nr:hypothetical protein [Thermoanaerobaculia bacterium]